MDKLFLFLRKGHSAERKYVANAKGMVYSLVYPGSAGIPTLLKRRFTDTINGDSYWVSAGINEDHSQKKVREMIRQKSLLDQIMVTFDPVTRVFSDQTTIQLPLQLQQAIVNPIPDCPCIIQGINAYGNLQSTSIPIKDRASIIEYCHRNMIKNGTKRFRIFALQYDVTIDIPPIAPTFTIMK